MPKDFCCDWKSLLAVEVSRGADSSRIHDRIEQLTEMVLNTFNRRLPSGGTIHIEEIQDQVELALMRTGEQKVARAYVIYREQRATAVSKQVRTIILPYKSLMLMVSSNH